MARTPSAGTSSLRASIAAGVPLEARSEALRTQHIGNINNLGQEQRRLANGAGSAVQQKFQATGGGPRGFANNLGQTTRRARARQGIINRGDAAIRSQQLRDRLTQARSSVGRRGQLMQTASNAARLRSGLDTAERRADGQVGSAFSGAAGAVAGGLFRGFGKFDTNIDPVDVGSAAADNSFFEPGFGSFGGNQIGRAINHGGMQPSL